MPLWEPCQSKPPLGAPIDRTRPLAGGLIAFYPANEAAGSTLVDACGQVNLACTGYATSNPWSSGACGAALSGTVASAGAVGSIPAPYRVGYPMTIACSFRLAAAPTGQQRFLGIFPSSSNVSPFVVLEFFAASATTLGIAYLSGSTPATQNVGSIAVGQDYTAVLAVTGAGWDCWVNGLHAAGQAIAIANPAGYASTAQVALANWPGVANASGGLVSWGGWWGRALTAGEAAAVSAWPGAIYGQLYGSPKSPFLMRAAAAAPPVHLLSLAGCGN